MNDDPPITQILSGTPGVAGRYLDQVRDPISGAYFSPRPPDPKPIAGVPESVIMGEGIRAAIVDSGLLLGHPWMARAVVESVDFTGEGPNDLNGHGTIVALMFLAGAPRANLVNVKALDKTGQGSFQALIDAVDWCVDQKIRVVNMSCGAYQASCRGDCRLCTAVQRANSSGTIVIPAAGNRHGDTTCPAKLALFYPDAAFAVGVFDIDTQEVPFYSGDVGPGGLLAPIPKYQWESEIDPNDR